MLLYLHVFFLPLSYWSLKYMCRFCSFPSGIALHKQHDFQCLYLRKVMSKSKMQMTGADAAVKRPNAWFPWLKPAAAIEAIICVLTQMVPEPIVSFSLSGLLLPLPPPLPTSSLVTKSLCLEVLILFEHYVNNTKTHHSWMFSWLGNSQKRRDVVFEHLFFSFVIICRVFFFHQ